MAKRPQRPQRDEYDSIEGTDFDGEESSQARPPKSKPDDLGGINPGRAVTSHMGRVVKHNSPAGSPLQGDDLAATQKQIGLSPTGRIEGGVRDWSGNVKLGPGFAGVLRAPRRKSLI